MKGIVNGYVCVYICILLNLEQKGALKSIHEREKKCRNKPYQVMKNNPMLCNLQATNDQNYTIDQVAVFKTV